MIVALVYVIQTSTPIETHYSTVQVNKPTKRDLVEEVSNRIDGCPIMNIVCVDCITVKNQLVNTQRRWMVLVLGGSNFFTSH